MKRNNTPWGPTPAAELDWNAQQEPYSRRFEDVYYARDDGLAESRHVFLKGNDLPQRWRQGQYAPFCIAETGFGTGLNFLLTWQAWRQHPAPRPRLHYISVEQYPLSVPQLSRALAAWPELADLAAELVAAWPGRLPGQHRICFENGRLVLDLWWEDATNAFTDLASIAPAVDAWYLDGFAPSRNQAMWQPALFSAMAALSRAGTTVATFTAAGAVRRGLEEAGFVMQKVPGYGRKRESLVGRAALGRADSERARLPDFDTPWDLDAGPRATVRSAVIIGAGLAGATLAQALAQRGVAVTVIDSGPVAGQASGNEQGILYTRLSRKHSSLTDFALQSFRYASTFYRQLFAQGTLVVGRDGELCGNYQQHDNAAELTEMRERLAGLEELAQVMQPGEAQAVLGVKPAAAGYWYPDAGWLAPPAVCNALLKTPNIRLLTQCGAVTLSAGAAGWQVIDASGSCVAEADAAIVCAGTDSTRFAQLEWLPLQSIRGQTTYLPATGLTRSLRAGLCHTGYIAPATGGRHCMGASFKLRDAATELRAGEHRENLDKLVGALPQWQEAAASLDVEQLQGRVGFRCASPDYLPIAGPVPDRSHFLQDYAGLRKNARQTIAERGRFVPGLFVNTAHGSRGLTSAPLCAQLLAARISGELPPLSRETQRALSPARFLVRDLARNKI